MFFNEDDDEEISDLYSGVVTDPPTSSTAPAGQPTPPPRRRVPSPTKMRTRRQAMEQAKEDEENEYVIVNLSLLNNLINVAYKEHALTQTRCKNPEFVMIKTSQKVISVELQMQCLSCSFVSTPQKMYYNMDKKLSDFDKKENVESQKGNRSTTLNVAFAAAITNSCIGTTQARKLLLEIGVDCGGKSSLQNLCNAVNPLMESLARSSMDTATEELIEQNKEGKTTYVSQDAIYNNRLRAGPFQAGTQVKYTTVGSNGKICEFEHENKVCPAGTKYERLGLGSCKEGHPGTCTRTLDEVEAISQEGRFAVQSLQKLQARGYTPKTLVVDGDAEIKKSIKNLPYDIEICYDVNHWVKGVERYLNANHLFKDDGTFHGQGARIDLKKMRESTMKKLCTDISNRCRKEIKICSEETNLIQDKELRIDSMLSQFSSDFKLAIIYCLQGQCGVKCRDHSLICEGKGKETSRENMVGDHIKLKGYNLKVAKHRVNEYFKRGRIEQIYSMRTTNINEAINRGFLRNDSKQTNCSRNYSGRSYREILHINEGVFVSQQMVNDAIGHKICASVKHRLEDEEKKRLYNRAYQQKQKVKGRRFDKLRLSFKKHTDHNRAKREQNNDGNTYDKHCDLQL